MVIFIPMPMPSSAGYEPWQDRPSKVAVGAAVAIFAAYLSIPLYSRAIFIDLPALFSVQTDGIRLSILGLMLPMILGIAFVVTLLATFLGAWEVRWWEWTLFIIGILLMLLWIPLLISANGELMATYCQELREASLSRWVTGCYSYL
jgi:hypothetical protein